MTQIIRKKVINLLGFGWVISLAVSLYMIFFYAPIDDTLGVSQKIFYIHLGAACAMAVCVITAFLNSVRYLYKNSFSADDWAAAASELAVVFGMIVLVTGMIWAKVAWGTFLPLSEIKLVTFLLLWVIFVVHLVLRGSIDLPHKKAAASAIFAILGFIVMPFVILATRWISAESQLHPVVMGANGAGMSAKMLVVLLVSIISWAAGAILLVYLVAKFRGIQRAIRIMEKLK